jgi:hypothetical protein
VNGDRQPLRTRFQRPERLLPFACIAGAAVLFASELMTTFEFTEGSAASGNTICSQLASDRHHFALGVLAIFAVGAVLVAVLAGSKPAAIGVAIAGLGALLLFLIVDLPDANNVGTLNGCSPSAAQSFFDAKAVPQPGFWLEMVGALALALSGAALATLSPDQLAALRPGRSRRSRRPPAEPALLDHAAELNPANPGEPEQPTEPAARRRQRT